LSYKYYTPILEKNTSDRNNLIEIGIRQHGSQTFGLRTEIARLPEGKPRNDIHPNCHRVERSEGAIYTFVIASLNALRSGVAISYFVFMRDG